jgi:hypothetical protein
LIYGRLDADGDVFGKIYEFFLGKFALSEGQKGGEFFTPTSVVRIMVEIIQPYKGSVINNISIISKLHRGNLQAFIELISGYFAEGMAALIENQQQVKPVSEQLLAVLDDEQGKLAVEELLNQWQGLATLEERYNNYVSSTSRGTTSSFIFCHAKKT